MKTVICDLNGFESGFSALFILAIVIIVMIGVFLLIRSIVLWYWKVDAIVENQTKQLIELKKISNLLEGTQPRNNN